MGRAKLSQSQTQRSSRHTQARASAVVYLISSIDSAKHWVIRRVGLGERVEGGALVPAQSFFALGLGGSDEERKKTRTSVLLLIALVACFSRLLASLYLCLYLLRMCMCVSSCALEHFCTMR